VCSSEGQTSIFTKYSERMLCVHLKGRLRYLPDILRECCVFISRADFDIYQIFWENVVCSSQGQISICKMTMLYRNVCLYLRLYFVAHPLTTAVMAVVSVHCWNRSVKIVNCLCLTLKSVMFAMTLDVPEWKFPLPSPSCYNLYRYSILEHGKPVIKVTQHLCPLSASVQFVVSLQSPT